MKVDCSSISNTDTKWSLRVVMNEVSLLKREREHLEAKSRERALTGWERERLAEIVDELTALFAEAHRTSGAMSISLEKLPT